MYYMLIYLFHSKHKTLSFGSINMYGDGDEMRKDVVWRIGSSLEKDGFPAVSFLQPSTVSMDLSLYIFLNEP